MGLDGFQVQHQPPESKTWSRIGFVESKSEGGTTTQPKSYRFRADNLASGTHRFRLRQVDVDGSATLSDPVTVQLRMDEALRLTGPSPNPVSGTATLSFAVKEEVRTTVSVYNVLGQQVTTLYEGRPTAGKTQRLNFDATDLPSGTYLIQLRSGGKSQTRRVTVVH